MRKTESSELSNTKSQREKGVVFWSVSNDVPTDPKKAAHRDVEAVVKKYRGALQRAFKEAAQAG